MQVQVTKIEFDLDDIDVLQQPNLQEQLQEEYVGLIYDLDVDEYSSLDDETIGDELVEAITSQSGWCINSIDYRIVLS